MIIYKALGLDIDKAEMLSFVGGGGKLLPSLISKRIYFLK